MTENSQSETLISCQFKIATKIAWVLLLSSSQERNPILEPFLNFK